MSLAYSVKQCCESDPSWIFVYNDGSILTLCQNHVKNKEYKIGVEEVININTQESFSPGQFFGD